MTEPEHNGFLEPPELQSVRQRRDSLLQEHEQILSRARNRPAAPAAPPSDTGTDSLLERFRELQCLVDVQRRKISDLLSVEKSYQNLHAQFAIMEDTNQKLVQQLLLFSDLDGHKKELEGLVDRQREELRTARGHLREARTRIDALRTRLLLLEDENAGLSERMEEYRIRLEKALDKAERDAKQLGRLQAELKRGRERYETQQRKYLKLREEYETMYRRK